MNQKLSAYLQLGIEKGISERYKCKIRNKWYVVSNVSKQSEGFFIKRAHHYPKLIKNEASILITDTAYKVDMRKGFNIESLVFSFYNSLTLLYSEIEGRYYGGGVLELTPREFKKLPAPYINISAPTFSSFAEKFKEKKDIYDLLRANDEIILKQHFKFTEEEIAKVQTILKKLHSKRLRIKTV